MGVVFEMQGDSSMSQGPLGGRHSWEVDWPWIAKARILAVHSALSSFAFTSRSRLLNTRSADSTTQEVGMVGPLPNFCSFLTVSGALWDLRVACPSNGFRLYLHTLGDTPLGTQGRLRDFPPVPGWLPVPYFSLWVSSPLTKPLRIKSLKCVRFCQLFSSW